MSAILATNLNKSNTTWETRSSFREDLDMEGSSGSAAILYDLLKEVYASRIKTVSNPPDDVRLDRELRTIFENCSETNWDNYGAKSINSESVKLAIQFIDHLPDTISYPELVPEPTGELGLVWKKRGFHIVVGIDDNGVIAYGGKSPSGRVYGDAKFNGEKIPDELLELLELVEGRT